MLFMPWETTCAQRNLTADIGGYDTINKKIKETLTLHKKGQKLIRSVSKSYTGCSRFHKIEYPELPDSYVLDIVKCKEKAVPRLLRWPENKFHDCCCFKTSTFKEKIQVEGLSLALLKWAQVNRKMKLKFQKMEKCIKPTLDVFLLELELIVTRKNIIKRSITFKEMPSALQDRISCMADEKLTDITMPHSTKQWHLEHKCFDADLKSSYIIHSIHPAIRKTQRKLFRDKEWVIDEKLRDWEESIRKMREQLLDVDFNALDFFKLKLPEFKTTSTSAKLNRLYNIKAWRIPRKVIKGLDWKPFKTSMELIWKNLQVWDAIEGNAKKKIEWSLTFRKLANNSIDFVDMESKSFSTLKIRVPDAGTLIDSKRQIRQSLEKESAAAPVSKSPALDHVSASSGLNTSLAPQGTSFIDDDLKSLLIVKKRKLASREEFGNTKCDVAPFSVSVLRTLNEKSDCKNVPRETIVVEKHTADVTQVTDPGITALDSFELFSIKKFIIINFNRIKPNHRVVQFLSRTSELRIIEQKTSLMCDFILNPITCVVRVQLNRFFQVNPNDELFFEEALIGLLAEFKRIIILLEYDSLLAEADRDVFWKVRQFLGRPEFEIYLSSNHYQAVGRWICMLAQKYSGDFDDQTFESMSAAEEVLLALNLNMFQIKTLLADHQISKVLLMACDKDNKELKHILTPIQLERLLDLVLLEW